MDVEILTVVKWVLIVLITGFITQFGRMMAQYIVRRIRERRAEKTQPVTPGGAGEFSENDNDFPEGRRNLLDKEREKEKIKQEKKLRKAEIKAAKKK